MEHSNMKISSERTDYLNSEYKGVDPLLKDFFKIKNELKINDEDMNNLLMEPVGIQTFQNWKVGYTSPSPENRLKISNVVGYYNPEKPNDLFLWKKRYEYRKRYEKQHERTRKTKNNPNLLSKQNLQNTNDSYRSFRSYAIEKQLIEIGKKYANTFDVLEVDELENQYIPIHEVNDLAYYKKKIKEETDKFIELEIEYRLCKEVENHVEYLTEELENERSINLSLKKVINNQEKEIHLLEIQKSTIRDKWFHALKYAEIIENNKSDGLVNDQYYEGNIEQDNMKLEQNTIINTVNDTPIEEFHLIEDDLVLEDDFILEEEIEYMGQEERYKPVNMVFDSIRKYFRIKE